MTPKATRHPILWSVTLGSAVVSFVIFVVGLVLLLNAPAHIEQQPFWSPLKDIGPAIAGSWVLCAALLAVTAAGLTVLATLRDADTRAKAHEAAIQSVCIGEIKAFWDRCNTLQLHDKLQEHVGWLKAHKDDNTKLDAFRRNFGDDWFGFFRVDPGALGELNAETSARFISLSAMTRNLTSRLNWLNSVRFDPERIDFWISYHNDTLELLNQLYTPSENVLALLGDRQTAPKSFTF